MKPYYAKDGIEIYCGDCREILPSLPQFDLVLTDPPYGIDYNPTRSQQSAASGRRKSMRKVEGDDQPFEPSQAIAAGTKAILWGGNNFASRLPDSNGWLIWDKRDGGSIFRGFIASDVEIAWSNVAGRTQMYSHKWAGHLRDSERGEFHHPTQKPVALMKWCISLVGDARDVLDPFMGSGTTLVAAKQMGLRAVGVEMDEEYCEIAVRRLSQKVLPLFAEQSA